MPISTLLNEPISESFLARKEGVYACMDCQTHCFYERDKICKAFLMDGQLDDLFQKRCHLFRRVGDRKVMYFDNDSVFSASGNVFKHVKCGCGHSVAAYLLSVAKPRPPKWTAAIFVLAEHDDVPLPRMQYFPWELSLRRRAFVLLDSIKRGVSAVLNRLFGIKEDNLPILVGGTEFPPGDKLILGPGGILWYGKLVVDRHDASALEESRISEGEPSASENARRI